MSAEDPRDHWALGGEVLIAGPAVQQLVVEDGGGAERRGEPCQQATTERKSAGLRSRRCGDIARLGLKSQQAVTVEPAPAAEGAELRLQEPEPEP